MCEGVQETLQRVVHIPASIVRRIQFNEQLHRTGKPPCMILPETCNHTLPELPPVTGDQHPRPDMLNYSSYDYYPLCLSENSDDGIECEIRNISQELIFNGTYEYIPCLLRVSGYLNARIHNISINMADRGLSEVRPANLYLQIAMA